MEPIAVSPSFGSTLDELQRLAPGIHIFTLTKQSSVQIPEGVPTVAEYYEPAELWPSHTKQRIAALNAQGG